MAATSPASPAEQVRAYFRKLTPVQRRAMRALQAAIRSAVPGSTHGFGYGIPAIAYQGKSLIAYAAWKDFESLYPVSAAMRRAGGAGFAKYYVPKATMRIPVGQPVPVALVKRIVKARVKEKNAS